MAVTVALKPEELTLPSVFNSTKSTFEELLYCLMDVPSCPLRVVNLVDVSQN